MNMDEKRIQLLQEELSKFADPGSDPLVIQQEGDKLVVILTRNGSVLTLASDDFYKSPIVLTEPDGSERKFATYRSLLASSLFSDLLLWAKRQKDVLSAKVDETTQIQPHGQLEPVNRAVENFDQIESEIRSLRDDSAQVRILLLDGQLEWERPT